MLFQTEPTYREKEKGFIAQKMEIWKDVAIGLWTALTGVVTLVISYFFKNYNQKNQDIEVRLSRIEEIVIELKVGQENTDNIIEESKKLSEKRWQNLYNLMINKDK